MKQVSFKICWYEHATSRCLGPPHVLVGRVPWWNDELENLLEDATRARRALKRAHRARRDHEELEAKVCELRQARRTLRNAIAKAKAKAWEDFVLTLNENPWGRPYKLVRDKLRRWSPPHYGVYGDSAFGGNSGGTFPLAGGETADWREPPLPQSGWTAWREDFEVSTEEILMVSKRYDSA